MSDSISDVCIDGQRYTLLNEIANYEDAKVLCEENGLSIAITTTFFQVQLVNNNFPSVWVGIEGDQTVFETVDINSFVHADGTALDGSFLRIGSFPWAKTQPNNSGGSGNVQNCVV